MRHWTWKKLSFLHELHWSIDMPGKSTVSGTTVVILIGSALLVFGIGPPVPRDATNDRGPRAVVAYAEQNLGTLHQGEVREVCFRVRNAGGRRLLVTDANVNCCGQAEIPSSFMVAPGDFVEIRLPVDTSGWCGHMRETFSFTTNDPRQPRLVFTALGEVVKPREGN
jgi:hypothetical protein